MKKQNKDFDRLEIRLSGSGGQGLIFAGVLLSEAVGVYAGKKVAQTQSYGPEARGGASRSDVVISDEMIYYPKCLKLDILLALTQEACDKYYSALGEEGVLIIDSTFVRQTPSDRAFSIPFTRVAQKVAGTPVVTNVVALGALSAITGIVDIGDLEQVVRGRAPKGMEDKNIAALKEGFKLGKAQATERKEAEAKALHNKK
ncbi:MAG: 2-oxoacid:ferredoxin oxidoreductase subunit gamma [candidate division Zixibacteria bacterium]|nr:2-oxoacid:ferredoxin oxidoreductase subunit gamma [candidate division Zixibacteria bacterium]